jgi:hypothetical protein
MHPEYLSHALAFHRASQVTRSTLYGTDSDHQLPLYLPSDARVPFLGFCGTGYRSGGTVLLAINPGGGGDKYMARTPQDNEIVPRINAFVTAKPAVLSETFQDMCESYSTQVQSWNLWRILLPTLKACNTELEDICYLNLFPYRTARDARPSLRALNTAWISIVKPLLQSLQPTVLVALGKKAGKIAESVHSAPPELFVVPRTIGDSYLCDEAKQVLSTIQQCRTILENRLV